MNKGSLAREVQPRTEVETGFTLAEITRPEDMDRIEPEWRALWKRDPRATPFQSPDWLVPWTLHLWGGGKLQILEIRRELRLAAVVPLFLWGRDLAHLSFLGSGISDYLGMTCDPEFAPAAARLVLRWIGENCRQWKICDLQELREGDPLLEAASAESSELKTVACSICPITPLPASLNDYLAGLEGKFRHNLQSAERRLHGTAAAAFVEAGERDWIGILDALFRLHEARWNGRNGTGVLSGERLRSFHREVAGRFLERGILRLYALLANGSPIGVQYNFTAKGRTYAYLSGFDTAWGRVSPGSLLLAHAIRKAIEEGIREFDFLRKPEEYKYWWGARNENTWRLVSSRGIPRDTIPLDDADAAVALENGVLNLV